MAIILPVDLSFPLPSAATSLIFSFSCSIFQSNRRIPVKSIPVSLSNSNFTFPFPGKVKPSPVIPQCLAAQKKKKNLGSHILYVTTFVKVKFICDIVVGPKFDFREKGRSGRSRITPYCAENSDKEKSRIVKEKSVSVILLAGGKGKRMGASMPKQYLPLLGQPIALYSLYTFSRLIQVKEIIVVCDPSYKDIFEGKLCVEVKFTLPGKERQDSVYSGLQAVDSSSELVCIHDSARPLVSTGDIEKVLKDGWLNGAAVLGVPVKATIKEANSQSFVVRTLDRKKLWEMQTPQVIKPDLLNKGFELVNRTSLSSRTTLGEEFVGCNCSLFKIYM